MEVILEPARFNSKDRPEISMKIFRRVLVRAESGEKRVVEEADENYGRYEVRVR